MPSFVAGFIATLRVVPTCSVFNQIETVMYALPVQICFQETFSLLGIWLPFCCLLSTNTDNRFSKISLLLAYG